MGLFYGRGAYFADSAAYCDESYAYVPREQPGPHQHRQLILAHVLCGEVKEYGHRKDRALKFPPTGFDSVRGGPHKFRPSAVHSCNMTVVYDRTQVYPQYIVTYSQGPITGGGSINPPHNSSTGLRQRGVTRRPGPSPAPVALPAASSAGGARPEGLFYLRMLARAWPVVLLVAVVFVKWVVLQ